MAEPDWQEKAFKFGDEYVAFRLEDKSGVAAKQPVWIRPSELCPLIVNQATHPIQEFETWEVSEDRTRTWSEGQEASQAPADTRVHHLPSAE